MPREKRGQLAIHCSQQLVSVADSAASNRYSQMLSEVVTYGDGVVSKGDMDIDVACHVGMNWKTVTLSSRGGHYLGTAITHSTL